MRKVIETEKENMHWADIQCAIYKSNSTPAEIAEQENVSRGHVSLVIKGLRKSHKVAYAIAAVTNIPTEQMWPGMYKQLPDKEVVNG